MRGTQETCLSFKLHITLENKKYNDRSLNLKLLMHELSAGLSQLLITPRPGGAGALNVWHSNYFPGALNTSDLKCY